MNKSGQINIKELSQRYQPVLRKSIWQLVNSIIPYFGMILLMYYSLNYTYWVTLLLAIPTAGLMVRIFIIFHDCGHGSFFKSGRLNDIFGYITGILTYFPYHNWRYNHARHHATCSDLDRRGVGDVWTLTVNEYKERTKREKFQYKLYRNPLIMFGMGSIYLFLISNRFIQKDAKKRERRSVYITNFSLLAIVLFFSYLIGFKAFLLLQLPVVLIAGSAGVWLFYVQHQFEDSYWEKHKDWDFYHAALKGSSFYRLPAILQWFTGNIGYHHVHHLNARIPNYLLQSCHEETERFREVEPITLWGSLKTIQFRLWDEQNERMIGFRTYRKLVTADP
jgi:omega-6 fatty acid desaturase (delta-12 desaturase)